MLRRTVTNSTHSRRQESSAWNGNCDGHFFNNADGGLGQSQGLRAISGEMASLPGSVCTERVMFRGRTAESGAPSQGVEPIKLKIKGKSDAYSGSGTDVTSRHVCLLSLRFHFVFPYSFCFLS